MSLIRHSIDDLLVCFRNPWTGGVARGAVGLGADTGTFRPKDQTIGLIQLHLAECEQAFCRDLKDFGRQSCTRRETSIHQRIQTPPSRHVVCHWQCRCDLLLDEEVENFIRMGSRSAEDTFSNQLGRGKSLEDLWVRITNNLEHLRTDSGHLVLCRDSEQG